MSTAQTVQEYVRASNDKFGTIWLIAVFVGGPIGAILFFLTCIWLFKFVANNACGSNFRPIHVTIWAWLQKRTPSIIYEKARARIQSRLQKRRQTRENNKIKHDVEKGTTSMIYHPEVSYSSNTTSEFTKAFSTPEQPIINKSSSFSQTISSIAKPKPVLKQHNEVWWKNKEGSDRDLSSLVRSIDPTSGVQQDGQGFGVDTRFQRY